MQGATTGSITPELLDKVFKSYDIRGKVGELTEDFYYILGKVIAKYWGVDRPILIGHDARLSAEPLARILAESFMQEGGTVWWVGLMPSEVRAFSLLKYPELKGAIAVTASHNPPEYIGAKLMENTNQDILEYSKKQGYPQIKQIFKQFLEHGVGLNSSDKASDKTSVKRLSQNLQNLKDVQQQVMSDFKQFVLGRLDVEKVASKKFKLVVDAGNGVAGVWFDYIFGDQDIFEYVPLYFEPDGNFPNHIANPSHMENVMDAIEVVKSQNLDFGAVFDGDADRIMFVDKKGRRPIGHIIGTMLAIDRLDKVGGGIVVQDVCLVFPSRYELPKHNGQVVIVPTGHVNVKNAMRQHNAVFGFEASAHFLHPDIGHMDSGFLSFVRFLNVLASSNKTLEQHVDYYESKYPYLPETNFVVEDRDLVLRKVEEHYKNTAKIDKTDGVAVEGPNWRFSVRKSNTEPVVRLFAEALDKPTLDTVVKGVTNLLKKFEDDAAGEE